MNHAEASDRQHDVNATAGASYTFVAEALDGVDWPEWIEQVANDTSVDIRVSGATPLLHSQLIEVATLRILGAIGRLRIHLLLDFDNIPRISELESLAIQLQIDEVYVEAVCPIAEKHPAYGSLVAALRTSNPDLVQLCVQLAPLRALASGPLETPAQIQRTLDLSEDDMLDLEDIIRQMRTDWAMIFSRRAAGDGPSPAEVLAGSAPGVPGGPAAFLEYLATHEDAVENTRFAALAERAVAQARAEIVNCCGSALLDELDRRGINIADIRIENDPVDAAIAAAKA